MAASILENARDLVDQLGAMAFASRLKRLHERLSRDVARLYADLGFPFQPRWFLPVYSLYRRGPAGVTELAQSLGLSHAAVVQATGELARAGWLTQRAHRGDRRRRVLRLTPRGKRLAARLEPVWEDIGHATEALFREAGVDPLHDLRALEQALGQRDIALRTRQARGESVASQIDILPYRPKFKRHFDRLNRAWLTEYFTVEPPDEALLSDPKGQIINRGGTVLFARLGDHIVGTCALIKHGAADYELAKMAVDPSARRLGAGRRLGESIVEAARQAGAPRLYLLTSTRLEAAIGLYRRMGFKPCTLPAFADAKYTRCTIAMKLELGRQPRRLRRE
jgi:DNA-binding MarR family transcriptional regulator